ncbi:MAG: hypothetical protein ABL962_12545 [Fimbriimonadaceae bacterium]
MPLINLIREQRLEVKKSERKARVFFMSFAASVMVGVGSFGFMLYLTEQAQGEKAVLEANAQKLEPFLSNIKDTNLEYGKVAPRVDTLTAARDLTDKWNRLMDHLTVQTPDRVASGYLLEFQIEASLKDTADEKERNEAKEEK